MPRAEDLNLARRQSLRSGGREEKGPAREFGCFLQLYSANSLSRKASDSHLQNYQDLYNIVT